MPGVDQMGNPYSGSGGGLNGLADLLRGLNSIRDPQADERKRLQELLQNNPQILEQYRQQYQDNPDALQALLGRKPMFGGSSYNQLESLITSKSTDPEVLAKKQEAKNRLANSTRLGDLITKGQKEEDINRELPVNESGVPQARMLGNTLEVPALTMNARERQEYLESKTPGGIRTPDARAISASELARSQAGLESQRLQNETNQYNLATTKEKKQEEEDDLMLAQQAIARLGAKSLFKASKDGTLSPEEKTAINNTKYKKTYDDSIDEYYKAENLKIAQGHLKVAQDNEKKVGGQIAEAKYINAAQHLVDRAANNGIELNLQDALNYVKSPSQTLQDTNPALEPIRETLKAIRDKETKKATAAERKEQMSEIDKIGSRFNSSTSDIRARTKLDGYNATQVDVDQMNEKSKVAWAGSTFNPITYKLAERKTPGKIWGTNTQTYIATDQMDPDLRKIYGDPDFPDAPVTKDKNVTTPARPRDQLDDAIDQFVAAGIKPDSIVEVLKSQGVSDPKKQQMVVERLKERLTAPAKSDTTSIKPDTSTAPVPIIPQDTTFQSVAGGSSRNDIRGDRTAQITRQANTQDSLQSVKAPLPKYTNPLGPKDTTNLPAGFTQTNKPETKAESPYKKMLAGSTTVQQALVAAKELIKLGNSPQDVLAMVPEKLRPLVMRYLGGE